MEQAQRSTGGRRSLLEVNPLPAEDGPFELCVVVRRTASSRPSISTVYSRRRPGSEAIAAPGAGLLQSALWPEQAAMGGPPHRRLAGAPGLSLFPWNFTPARVQPRVTATADRLLKGRWIPAYLRYLSSARA